MKPNSSLILSLAAAALLSACAGPSPKPAPAAPRPPPTAKVIAPRFYTITFDAQGVAHDRTRTVVDRERVRFLINRGDIDRHSGIRIEVPKGITDRQKNIEAFARAQQIAKIFDLLGFEAVVVVLAEK